MHIQILTPAPPGSRAGNRATAERWATLLENAGHRVSVITGLSSEDCDLFIALHAWRSHEAIRDFRRTNPAVPVIAVLTGTDIYHHQFEYPDDTHKSMALADSLIGLHHGVADDIPEAYRSKLMTVVQSAGLITPSRTDDHYFDVCVIGHLRDEKDSLRAALACHYLPEISRVRVFNAGNPHSESWQRQAEAEQARNPRFQWLGELDKQATDALMARSRVMVISSVMEGGANVVSEACRAGLPIIASDIPGNRGLLGTNYPGYFRVKDEQHLAELLYRAESSPDYLSQLQQWVAKLAGEFVPEAEQAALLRAIEVAIANSKKRLSPED
ncbi:glycosyltransferase [Marinobacter lipolyticus SM19]|uniref:Glycosyltransferase n=1 Tax=Marinobacter lipolyticus SM19 TaxID=1318628 RepID=R8B1W3_9GAMM|nr:selenoneine biosynthesis selenosugar synthase SenB [Marinobacter lipolyticus]EON92565.1 glycosyltransferase [Marinobacter lipolyticus SM19]